ncbi:MAG TPA: hypothetical protein VMU93_02950 [Caulobacteraceae bacterium]|nr:hypothetical protein [Caulobacteraceae bacterium]
MEKVLVARRVATKLRATEAAVDAALTQATEMMGEMIRGRQELNVSAVATDPSMARIAAAIAALTQARTAMVDAHGELDELRLRIGIRTRMDIENKAEPETASLREVA